MTNGQRTITTLLAIVAALLAVNIIVQTARPAKAATVPAGAAGTCPSDVNGDAVVNVLDLVDLLLDFGTECPGPQLVDVTLFYPQAPTLLRAWSDGSAEYKIIAGYAAEPQVWTVVPPNVNAPASRVVGVTRDTGTFYRLWMDGTVDRHRFEISPIDGSIVPSPEGWVTECREARLTSAEARRKLAPTIPLQRPCVPHGNRGRFSQPGSL